MEIQIEATVLIYDIFLLRVPENCLSNSNISRDKFNPVFFRWKHKVPIKHSREHSREGKRRHLSERLIPDGAVLKLVHFPDRSSIFYALFAVALWSISSKVLKYSVSHCR